MLVSVFNDTVTCIRDEEKTLMCSLTCGLSFPKCNNHHLHLSNKVVTSITVESPNPPVTTANPKVLKDFKELFSKTRSAYLSTQLFNPRFYICREKRLMLGHCIVYVVLAPCPPFSLH